MSYGTMIKIKTSKQDAATSESGIYPAFSGAAISTFGSDKIARAFDLADDINPASEDTYWRENFETRSYAEPNARYSQYRGAYLCGVYAYQEHKGIDFSKLEAQLSKAWNETRGQTALTWDKATHAARDAYERLRNRIEHL